MEFLRTFKTEASAGENTLDLLLPEKAVLKIVNLYNNTTGWLRSTAMLAKVESPTTDPETISLMHRIIQCGLKDVKWEGEIKLENPYRVLRSVFSDCTLNDRLDVTAGYEF